MAKRIVSHGGPRSRRPKQLEDRVPTRAEMRSAREALAGPGGPGNHLDADVLATDLIGALRECEATVSTVCGALNDARTPESLSAAVVLRRGCSDLLLKQIEQLQRLAEAAKFTRERLGERIITNVGYDRAAGVRP
jgi:hypothetical protein